MPFAVFLNADDKNYVEPDISVICGTSKLNDKGCMGAPDWIIEIVSPGNRQTTIQSFLNTTRKRKHILWQHCKTFYKKQILTNIKYPLPDHWPKKNYSLWINIFTLISETKLDY